MIISENQKQKTNKAALYCRVASPSPEDARSIEIQRDTLRSFAERQGFAEYTEYLDNGYNGNNLDRPAFMQMEADIQAGKVDTVIVRSIDRIARDMFLCNKWVDSLGKRGVKLIAADGSHEHYSLFIQIYQSFIGVV